MSTKPIVQFIEKPMSGEWGVEPTNGHAIGVIRNANFTNEGVMDLSDIAYRDIPEKKINQKALKHGDIIIEKSGGSPTQPVGRVVYYDRPDGELMFSNFTAVLRPRPGVDSRYLFFMLWATHLFKKTSAYQNKTTGIANLQLERYINEVELPEAPLPEQRRIAAILDKAQALVANDKRTLAVYDQLAKSLFLEMFGDPVRNERGWEVVDMDSVATKVTDGEHATPKRSDSGYLLLSARNIRNRTLDLSHVDHVEQAEFDRIYRRCNPAQGDILISCSGSIGRVTMVRTAEPFVLVRSVALIKPDTKRIDASYLEQYLLTDHMQATMNNSAKSSSQANLFTGPIKALPVMLPPMSMQLKWKKAIEGVDSHRSMAENSLRQSEALFGSLLQSAFAGGFCG